MIFPEELLCCLDAKLEGGGASQATWSDGACFSDTRGSGRLASPGPAAALESGGCGLCSRTLPAATFSGSASVPRPPQHSQRAAGVCTSLVRLLKERIRSVQVNTTVLGGAAFPTYLLNKYLGSCWERAHHGTHVDPVLPFMERRVQAASCRVTQAPHTWMHLVDQSHLGGCAASRRSDG